MDKIEEKKEGAVLEEPKKELEVKKDTAPVTLDEIKALLEKNLKWSQIIYEQNRKINRNLMWQAISGWLRILLVMVPLLLALWFLPSYVGQFMDKYGYLFGVNKAATTNQQTTSVDQMIKLLPLDAAKQEQIKTLLK